MWRVVVVGDRGLSGEYLEWSRHEDHCGVREAVRSVQTETERPGALIALWGKLELHRSRELGGIRVIREEHQLSGRQATNNGLVVGGVNNLVRNGIDHLCVANDVWWQGNRRGGDNNEIGMQTVLEIREEGSLATTNSSDYSHPTTTIVVVGA